MVLLCCFLGFGCFLLTTADKLFFADLPTAVQIEFLFFAVQINGFVVNTMGFMSVCCKNNGFCLFLLYKQWFVLKQTMVWKRHLIGTDRW